MAKKGRRPRPAQAKGRPKRRSTRPAKRAKKPVYKTLKAYFKGSKVSQAELAERCGVTQPHMSRLAKGLQIPRGLLQQTIVKETGIPLDAFIRSYLKKQQTKHKRTKRTETQA